MLNCIFAEIIFKSTTKTIYAAKVTERPSQGLYSFFPNDYKKKVAASKKRQKGNERGTGKRGP